MDLNQNTIIAIAVVLILFIFYYYFTSVDYLYGFWTAEGDEFCENAEIDSILLFIGREEGLISKERPAYLIIMDDLANDSLTLSYYSPICMYHRKTYNVSVKFEEEQIWPEKVQMDVDPFAGTLKIYSEDTVYALLYKQHETTNMAAVLD